MTPILRSVPPTLALLILLGACSAPASTGSTQTEPNAATPGWTGRTLVQGSTSTVAGDATATEMQQKWPLGRDH